MKLQDARGFYFHRTAKASDIARQLSFAAIAIIWIFRVDSVDGPAIPQDFLLPGLLVVVALTLDLLQYVISGALWGIFHRQKELAGTHAADDFKAPRALNWPANLLYWGKLICVVVAYVLLAWSLWARLVVV